MISYNAVILICFNNIFVMFQIDSGCVASHADFGYDSGEQTGPEHWAEHFHTCDGRQQSPINIDDKQIQRTFYPIIDFQGFDDSPTQFKITNNGHSVQFELNEKQNVFVEGGPFHSSYTFAQLHFHWGQNDSVGSEHKINRRSYSMELHMVFYKTEYKSVKQATDFKDGLLVLATFYKVGKSDNKLYSEIANSLQNVESFNTSTNSEIDFSLGHFLPPTDLSYFTYQGSLTTPPCSEVVTWVVFKYPSTLSHSQLSAFRKIRTKGGLLTHNYRPLQPLSGRTVYSNEHFKAPPFNKADSSVFISISVILASTTLWFSLFLVTV